MKSIKTQSPYRMKPCAVAILLAAETVGAGAQNQSLYVGAALGGQSYPSTLNGVSTSGSAASGNVFGGYQFNENFALELGLVELGAIRNGPANVDSYGAYVDAWAPCPSQANGHCRADWAQHS